MKEPKVQIKSLKTFAGHDAATGFNADIWINGIKCRSVFDAAYGGEYEFNNYTHNNPKAKQVEANIALLDKYIEQLPELESKFGDSTVKLKMDWELYIGEITDKMINDRETKKFEKAKLKKMLTCILIGKPDTKTYQYYNYKRALSSYPVPFLQKAIDRIKGKDCTNGNVILNTNLTELGIVL